MLPVEDFPSLEVAAFTTELREPLADAPSPEWLVALLAVDAEAPFRSDADVRSAIRDLLRARGYKPTGRGKPASEYLLKAAGNPEGMRSINVAVDACNVASLHSGLPISVVDLDRAVAPLAIAVAPPEAEYVFNPSGQKIRVGGLPCLCDAEGPCANAVKDAQRTKTTDSTRRTLSVVWGTDRLAGRAEAVARWYRDLLESAAGAVTAAARLGP